MSLPVHLVPSLDGAGVGSSVTVEGDEAHHAVAVRRLRVGESVVLTDGLGTSVTGAVASTGKRVFELTVASVSRDPAPEPAFVVVQAIPKGDRGELAVEVLTEIGVAEIVPWAADRSVAVWKGERAAKSLSRWRSTAREAAKQARRSWFPTVPEMASTADVVGLVAEADLTVVLHEEASAPLGVGLRARLRSGGRRGRSRGRPDRRRGRRVHRRRRPVRPARRRGAAYVDRRRRRRLRPALPDPPLALTRQKS